jgi:hypothetical protein
VTAWKGVFSKNGSPAHSIQRWGSSLDASAELLNQARFSDPRLAHHQHELSLTLAYSLPSAERETHLVLASDKGSQPACDGTMRAPLYHAGLDNVVQLNWMLIPLEPLCTAILDHE